MTQFALYFGIFGGNGDFSDSPQLWRFLASNGFASFTALAFLALIGFAKVVL